MASPWKFLARLTLRRGDREEQQNSLADSSVADEAAIGNTPNPSDRLEAGELQAADQPDVEMTVPEHSAEARSNGPENADLEDARLLDTAGPNLSDEGDFTRTPIHHAPTFSSFNKRPRAKQKRSKEVSVVKSAEVFPQLSTSVPNFPEEVQNLDKEIGLLRIQLALKLQQQNEQLRVMLGRFER